MAPKLPGRLLVMGAGAVGCFVGGRLQAAGADVDFVGRPRVLAALRGHGLRLSDLDGGDHQLPAQALALHPAVPEGLAPALTLLCVKSGATTSAAAELAQRLAPGSLLLSLQNGVVNAGLAALAAPALTVLPGMVAFNVAELGPGHYHRGSSGELAAQDHPALRDWQPLFAAAGLPLQLHADLAPICWAKLLLNLNNPVNALSALPLRAQLLDRSLRRVTAALQAEALAVLARAGIKPARLTPLPPAWVPALLRLPTPLFQLAAARLLRIDERARSSMADDLALGRATEIDALCGEIVGLAARCGSAAPLNARMIDLVRRWPADPRPRSGAELALALAI
ncbi:MAG: 2-dehydropantoate 2-reductase [Rubrivivax sp.]|nr:2-dehydropantoate 2-reductase [Rubrivivax sp.]